jgi:hypothetical protein
MIEQLTISLRPGNDAMKIVNSLNSFINIEGEAIDQSTIKVSYNTEKLVAKKLVKIIQSVCNPDHRNRKRNIQSVKQLTQ